MRISAVRFSGFRGARGIVSLDLSSSFVVIVGRNGTGKSTICDAIEFALTGELRPDSPHKEKNESIMNYIWWRGAEEPPDGRFVEVELTDDDGARYQVRRTQTEKVLPANLADVLCAHPKMLENPLSELCRTTILRDEDITRLSVDLKETERFDTVRLSQLRTEIADPQAVEVAVRLLQKQFADQAGEQSGIIERAVKFVAAVRGQVDALTRAYVRCQNYERRLAVFRSEERLNAMTSAEADVRRLRQSSSEAEIEAAELNEELVNLQKQSPRNASLALLREHGQRLGLLDGCCPLCGAEHSLDDFARQLAQLERKIAESHAALAELTRRATEATARATALKAELGRSSAKLLALRREESELKAEYEAIREDTGQQGFELDDGRPEAARLSEYIESLRARAAEFEAAIQTIRASTVAEHTSSLENDLRAAKDELSAAEKRLAKATKALHMSSEAVDAIKRTRGEFVNEQLAQLEPLLVELYQRLRPHVDWPVVQYRVRGDVRRMLRLEVGDGLNPSFVFSSGQRRAAGLAFLLALHLSRSWCKLKSLILDDPVQHIDDYRALHLTELLAAVRTTQRQIICAIEDEALGKLLARRLRVGSAQAGMIVQMAYSSRDGIHVAGTTPVQPMPPSILIPIPASA